MPSVRPEHDSVSQPRYNEALGDFEIPRERPFGRAICQEFDACKHADRNAANNCTDTLSFLVSFGGNFGR